MEDLPPAKKGGGLLGFFTGTGADGARVRGLLDELQQLSRVSRVY